MEKELREKRKERKITVKEMAKFLGFKSDSTYSKKERKEIPITIDEAKKMCVILNCSMDEIFFKNKLSQQDNYKVR